MGSLLPFLGGGADSDLPFQRRTLARNKGERAGLVAETAQLKAMRADLVAKLGAVDQAEAERDALLARDAQGLLDRMRSGVETTLSTFGLKARTVDEKIAASLHQAKVAQLAIDAIDRELANIEAKIAGLDELAELLVADAVRETMAPEFADYQTAVENMRECLVRLTALDRVLAPPPVDYVPNSRVVVTLPDFSGERPEQVVLAPEREIAKAEAIIRQFKAAIAQDVRTKAPTFPPIDANEDPSLPYHSRSAPERFELDREALPLANRQRETVDSRLFSEQIKAAKAANS